MKRNVLIFAVGALLLAIFVVLLFFFQVRKSEVAVVTRFGATVRDYTEPGAYFKWPRPIERVYKLDQRIQSYEDDKLDEIQTADNYIIMTMVYVGWRISEPKDFFPTFAGGSIPEAERQLKDLVRSAKNAVIGKHPFADVVNTDAKLLKFDDIEREMRAHIQQQLATNRYGISVEFLGLKKLGLPDSVTTAVFERMKSEREVLAKRFESEGESEARKIKSDADRVASDMVSSANSQAKDIRGRGESEAAKYLATFRENPGLANFLFRLDALELSLKDRSTLIFDQQTPPFDLLGRGAIPTNATSRSLP